MEMYLQLLLAWLLGIVLGGTMVEIGRAYVDENQWAWVWAVILMLAIVMVGIRTVIELVKLAS